MGRMFGVLALVSLLSVSVLVVALPVGADPGCPPNPPVNNVTWIESGVAVAGTGADKNGDGLICKLTVNGVDRVDIDNVL